METKAFPSSISSIQDYEVTGISAVMGVIDAGLDLIHKGAFTKTLQEHVQRVKHLWQHDNTQPPIATVVELKEIGRTDLPSDMKERWPMAKGGLLVKRRYLETPRAMEVLAGLKSDPPAITEMSFGYDPVQFDFEEVEGGALVRNLRQLRLWDTSDVNWGMNEATVAGFVKALPFLDTGTAKKDVEWKAPTLADFTDKAWEDLSDAVKTRIASHFAWSKDEVPEQFEDLKFPHHEPSKTSVGKAIWLGTKAAMKNLIQSEKSLSDTEKGRVYTHLSKHYEQFNETPPEYKRIQLIWNIGNALTWMSNDTIEFSKLQELEELLRAEPPDVALTLRLEQEKLLTRLAMKKRQLYILS
jgi:HK97 family phage prohead protease